MKGCLIVIGIALLILVVAVYLQNGGSFVGATAAPRPGNAVACQSSTTTFTGVRGIGVGHTANVTARLLDPQGRVIVPSQFNQDTSDNGIRFQVETYIGSRVTPGTYRVEVVHQGRVIETYSVFLTDSNSPTLYILCS